MRARVLYVSLLAVSIGVGIACGGGDEASLAGSPDGSPLTTEATRESAGARLTLSVDREVYEVGDPVKIRAEAENIRSEQLLFRPVSPELPPVRLGIETEIAGLQELEGGRMEGGDGAGLAPGGKVVREFEWDQQLATYQTPVQAPEGTYEVSAQVLVSPDEVSRPDAVAIVVRFRLEGGEPVVAPEAAIESAIFHDEVTRWFEGRGAGVEDVDLAAFGAVAGGPVTKGGAGEELGGSLGVEVDRAEGVAEHVGLVAAEDDSVALTLQDVDFAWEVAVAEGDVDLAALADGVVGAVAPAGGHQQVSGAVGVNVAGGEVEAEGVVLLGAPDGEVLVAGGYVEDTADVRRAVDDVDLGGDGARVVRAVGSFGSNGDIGDAVGVEIA